MKKIIKPQQQEDAVYYSDFTGECFGDSWPPVEIKIEFNYGSKYDSGNLQLHLTDKEVDPIIELIKANLSEDKKFELKKLIKKIESQLDDSIDSRCWDSAEICSNNLDLYKFLLDIK
jgi:hypothetical protein